MTFLARSASVFAVAFGVDVGQSQRPVHLNAFGVNYADGEVPSPVNDFWDMYRAAGGKAGGGFRALEAVGLPVSSPGPFGGLSTGLLAVLRRHRRGIR
jgi:hypothetical protein